jgi:hypothetical protein
MEDIDIARIDFIICEINESWYITSQKVPVNVACKSNDKLVEWMERELRKEGDMNDVMYIGVYWRDPNIDTVSSDNVLN